MPYACGYEQDTDWNRYTEDAISGTGRSGAKLSVVSEQKRDGNSCGRVRMPDPSGTSHFMWRPKEAPTWKMGDDAWIGVSIRFGDDWKMEERQLRNDGQTFCALFGFRGNVANGPGGGVYLTWNSGRPRFHARTVSGSVGATTGPVYFGDVKKNVWYDLVIHVKWSNDPKIGIREYWLNGEKVATWRGVTMYTPMTVRNRMGIYQGGGVDHQRTVYYDNHRVGNSFAEVDPANFRKPDTTPISPTKPTDPTTPTTTPEPVFTGQLVLSTNNTTPGQTVNYTGSAFKPNHAGWIKIGEQKVAEVRSDLEGSFSGSFKVPELPHGSYHALASVGWILDKEPFTIGPAQTDPGAATRLEIRKHAEAILKLAGPNDIRTHAQAIVDLVK